jgi:hypothetical protein
MTTYRMLRFDDAAEAGQGDAELARESMEATGENGAVGAYLGSDGVLHRYPEHMESTWSRIGRERVVVYLHPSVDEVAS